MCSIFFVPCVHLDTTLGWLMFATLFQRGIRIGAGNMCFDSIRKRSNRLVCFRRDRVYRHYASFPGKTDVSLIKFSLPRIAPRRSRNRLEWAWKVGASFSCELYIGKEYGRWWWWWWWWCYCLAVAVFGVELHKCVSPLPKNGTFRSQAP